MEETPFFIWKLFTFSTLICYNIRCGGYKMNIFKKLIDSEYRELCRFEEIADKIDALEEEYSKLSDEELKNKTQIFKDELSKGTKLDDLIVPAFATVREAAYRVIGEKPFHVQLLGGLALHFSNIAEMKTGEGKTLTATMPTYLNALTGKGVHIVTVNEFLAQRDSEWMGNIYRFLGLTVGLNLREMSAAEKQAAYNCDVLYSTNNEIGFDYLRDNMVVKASDRVQRPLNYCIVDEVDSILIDEARTPLIISGGKIDAKTKNVSLTESGSQKIESIFHLNNLYDIENSALVHHLNQALKANYGFKKDVDYVIEDGAIIIVDQFTGRLMHGRQFSEGLHQAIEAKENVKINEETQTMATITFQNLFRMYKKLSGMTGTAKTEEEEFTNIYNMYVIQIPTNKPVVRKDLADLVYATEKGKFTAIVNTIKEIHSTGQPILVGTISVEKNELLGSLLTKASLPHEILNAKNHEREAEIIARAGQKGSITIATNMAGRGTDIKLGDGIKELGGLYVFGTERHDSRRIDNQLRGRSGRQGDPGTTRFFVSMEDDLMLKFGSERMKTVMESLGIKDDQAISNKMISKNIESAQKKVEGFNFDRRKGLLDYDNVISKQREIIYERRNEILDKDSIRDRGMDTFKEFVSNQVKSHLEPEGYLTDNDIDNIIEQFNAHLLKRKKLKDSDFKDKSTDEVIDMIYAIVVDDYSKKLEDIPEEIQNDFEKSISLRIIDKNWMDQLDAMENLKEGVGLRGYAQSNPLQVYALEGFNLFDNMMATINGEITQFLLNETIRQNIEREEVKNIHTNDGKDGVKSAPKKASV